MNARSLCGKSVLAAAIAAAAFSVGATEEDIRVTPVVKAVRKVSPAVVNISTERIITVRYDPFYGRGGVFHFWDRPARTRKYKTSSLGSGVIIDKYGYILTNDHVTSKASRIIVTLGDGKEYEGRLISTYPEKDLAVVRIEGDRPFPYIELGNSDDLMIGETTIAIGNPYALKHTVTTGVLSAMNRSVEVDGHVVFDNFIQTDAAINPGNSGGALLNLKGELIGINTAIYAKAEGIGFAIPVNTVKEVLEILLDPRKINKTWFGAELRTITGSFAEEKKLKPYEGIYITEIDKGSPAEKMGLRAGDILIELDGKTLKCTLDYHKIVLRKGVGDPIKVRYRRGGSEKAGEAEIAKLPKPSPHDLAMKKFGFDVTKITAEIARSLYVDADDGVLVSKVVKGGPADQRGMERGDVIVQLSEYRVNSLDDIAIILDKIKSGDTVSLGFIRGKYIIRTRLTAK